MNQKLYQVAAAALLVVAAGCGDEQPTGPPPGVDLTAGQSAGIAPEPTAQKPGKTAKRGDVHIPGPSTTLE